MENNTVTLYEYTLHPKTSEFMKKVHQIVIEKNKGQTMYRIDTGNRHQYRNWIRENDLGKIYRGKIFSLVEDDELYRQMMIEHYVNRIAEINRKLELDKKILLMLKEKTSGK